MERELPEGWVETTVGEVLYLEYGKSLPAKSREGDEYPVMGSNGEVGRNSEFLIEGPGIVVGRKGSYGEVNWVEENFFPIDTTYYVQVTEAIDLRFAYNLLKSCDFKSLNRSTAIPGLNRNDAYQLNFPLPPLAEQKRIVAKLDEAFQHLDTLKAKLERIPELLKNFRQAVLTQAVTGKLTEDWREIMDTDEIDSLVIQYKKDREANYSRDIKIQKTEGKSTPKLPEFEVLDNATMLKNWVSLNVESTSVFIIDCLHSTPKFVDEGEYCIDTTCITPFKIIWDRARKITPDSFREWTSRLQPRKGDILFSREGTIGTAVHFNGEHPICLGQRMMMFRFADFVHPKFAEIYLSSPYFKTLYKPFIVGTSAQHLNIGSIRKLEFLVPPLEEQNKIVKRVEALFGKADAIEGFYTSLKEKIDKLPQAILAKAFRGELVPQNPNDEPASMLLEKIKTAKAGAVKSGKGKKAKGGKQGEFAL